MGTLVLRSIPAFLSAVMTLAAFAMSVNAIPPVVTSIAGDFGFSINSFGYLFSLQFFVFMIASFAGGAILEKTRVKPGLLVAVGLLGLSLAFFILPFLSLFRELLLWIVILGFSGGLVETFASVIISGYDSPGSGRLLNLSQVFYCVGAISAPQIVAIFLDRQVPWQSIFVFFGILEILLAILFIVFSFGNIRGFSNAGMEENTSRKSLPSGGIETGKREYIAPKESSLFNNPIFITLSFAILIYVLSESFLVFWLPAYLEVHYSFSTAAAARGVSYFWVGLIVGRITAVFFPDRIPLWLIIIVSASGMLVCSFILSFRWDSAFLIIMIIILGIFSGPLWATIVSIGKYSSRSPRFIAGIIGAGSLGASLGPLVSSSVIRAGGFASFFPVLSVGILLLLILIIVSKRIVLKKEYLYK